MRKDPVMARISLDQGLKDLAALAAMATIGCAEALAVTPPYLPDELVSRLRGHLGEAELAELTAAIEDVTRA
jgi:alkylhydroperoxidase/carboxymuconolactone decarboxylase family protein YurZ